MKNICPLTLKFWFEKQEITFFLNKISVQSIVITHFSVSDLVKSASTDLFQKKMQAIKSSHFIIFFHFSLSLLQAFGSLKRLRYLYLSNNNISQLPYEVFAPNLCSTLRAMKLASNGLQRYPTEVLHRCKSLSHLDLGYNR